MPLSLRPIAAVALLLLPACDKGSEPSSVMGAPPQEAAQIATDVVCEYVERCGRISVACPDCDEGQSCSCTADLHEVSFELCTDELGPELETGFGCEPLTPEEETAIDTCLAALPEHACVTEEQAEAWANGGGGNDPRLIVPECEVLEDIRYRCFEQEVDPNTQTPDPVD